MTVRDTWTFVGKHVTARLIASMPFSRLPIYHHVLLPTLYCSYSLFCTCIAFLWLLFLIHPSHLCTLPLAFLCCAQFLPLCKTFPVFWQRLPVPSVMDSKTVPVLEKFCVAYFILPNFFPPYTFILVGWSPLTGYGDAWLHGTVPLHVVGRYQLLFIEKLVLFNFILPVDWSGSHHTTGSTLTLRKVVHTPHDLLRRITATFICRTVTLLLHSCLCLPPHIFCSMYLLVVVTLFYCGLDMVCDGKRRFVYFAACLPVLWRLHAHTPSRILTFPPSSGTPILFYYSVLAMFLQCSSLLLIP